MLRIYVSGPLSSSGHRPENVKAAIEAGLELIKLGYAPMVPHLNDHMDPTDSLGYDTWLDIDLAWVEVSDAVLRLPGESRGADIEVARAEEIGLPVYRSLAELKASPPGEGDPGFLRILNEARILHNGKQQDYGKKGDPFANVRASERFGIAGWIGAIMRGNDKMERIQSFIQKGVLRYESVEDSLRDLMVYVGIALRLYRERVADGLHPVHLDLEALPSKHSDILAIAELEAKVATLQEDLLNTRRLLVLKATTEGIPVDEEMAKAIGVDLNAVTERAMAMAHAHTPTAPPPLTTDGGHALFPPGHPMGEVLERQRETRKKNGCKNCPPMIVPGA